MKMVLNKYFLGFFQKKKLVCAQLYQTMAPISKNAVRIYSPSIHFNFSINNGHMYPGEKRKKVSKLKHSIIVSI